ncbi:zinc knuckle CX2CX4HX4C containing protein [Tanacetum coccineum]
METGFLLGNKSSKKSGLAAKVTNIEGKLLGKDGKPLKSCLKNASSKTNQSKPVGEACSHSVEAGNKVNLSTDYPKPTIATHVTETIVPTDDTNMKPMNSSEVAARVYDDTRCKQFQQKKIQVSALINDEKVVGANVPIPMAVVDEFSDIFANTLYGYFIGERLAFPTVEAYVKNAWEKYGFERAIFRNGFFLFKFLSHDGMVRTIEGGPWFIRSVPIFLNIWQVNTKMKREIMSKVFVWVRIHNVPIVAFSEDGLSLITTQLGRPIMLDAYTSDMCLNSWGRSSYARVLVELSSECAAMETIVVAIPLPMSKGHYLETLEFEYEWWPPRCSKCKIFGHEDDACSSRVNKANLDSLEGMSSLCDDGAKLKKKAKSNHLSIMDDSYGPVNEHGYYKDDIDLEQLRSTMDKLMDENKVLDINPNTISEGSGETMHSNPNDKGGLTTHVSAHADVNVSVKGSLWDQFTKRHGVSTSKLKSSINGIDGLEVKKCASHMFYPL